MVVHLWKVDPNTSVSLDLFYYVRWYVDKEVYIHSAEEAEFLEGWFCKVGLMRFKWAIILKVHSLKRGCEQERLYSKECPSLQSLRQIRCSIEKLQKSRYMIEEDWSAYPSTLEYQKLKGKLKHDSTGGWLGEIQGAIGEWYGSNQIQGEGRLEEGSA